MSSEWSALDDLPCAVVQTDEAGRIEKASSTFKAWMDPRHLAPGERLQDFFDTPGKFFFETHMNPLLRMQGFVREVVCRIKTPSGLLPVLLNARVHHGKGDEHPRIVFLLLEIREREDYERALREERNKAEQLAAIARVATVAIVRTDEKGVVLTWNPAAHRLFGLTSNTAVGQHIETVIGFAGEPDWFSARINSLCQDDDCSLHFEAEAEDDRHFHVSIDLIRIHDNPDARDYSVILRDITARVRSARQIDLLIDELNHRVRNTLSIVSGIARQTFRGLSDVPEVEAFLQRIDVYAKFHTRLTQSSDKLTDMRGLLEMSRQMQGSPDAIKLEGPSVELEPKLAMIFLLALHELFTNAVKYGALSVPGGSVDITWGLDEKPRPGLSIRWREKDGPPVSPPSRTGFGSIMIKRALAMEANGQVDLRFEPSGVECDLRFPYDFDNADD